MKCPNCDTINQDNAKFCRTCGINLQENNAFVNDEEEKVYTPTIENNINYQQNNTTNTQNKSGSSDWLMCCVCLVAIFIIFAIIGSF